MLIQGNTETYEPVTTCRPGEGGGAGDIGGIIWFSGGANVGLFVANIVQRGGAM